MKIIISPTKTMRKDCDNHSSNTIPMFINKTSELLVMMKGFDCKQLEKIYRCSEKIANDNYLLFQNMDLYNDLTQAVNCYCGISYKYLASSLMNQNQLSYLNDHLRILSGFYGILRPFDGIREYRLDFYCMSDLYQFWSDLIYKEMFKDKEVIINLASKEYSVLLEKYLQSDDELINVDFLHLENGKYKVKSTYSKMARGSLARYMCENNIEEIKDIKSFTGLGFSYCQKLSNERNIVFVNES